MALLTLKWCKLCSNSFKVTPFYGVMPQIPTSNPILQHNMPIPSAAPPFYSTRQQSPLQCCPFMLQVNDSPQMTPFYGARPHIPHKQPHFTAWGNNSPCSAAILQHKTTIPPQVTPFILHHVACHVSCSLRLLPLRSAVYNPHYITCGCCLLRCLPFFSLGSNLTVLGSLKETQRIKFQIIDDHYLSLLSYFWPPYVLYEVKYQGK